MDMLKTLQKKRMAVAALSAAVFYFLSNGYRFFNPLFSGDALYMIYQNDAAWQIALGRVGQPFLVFLRGGITAPFLILILSMFWIMLAAALVTQLLDLRGTGYIVAVSALMSCHISWISANANFLPWGDFYAFALFLAVIGVWLVRKEKVVTKIAGIAALAFCMSVYQAYICVAIGLLMILLLLELQEKPGWTDFLKKALWTAAALCAGAAAYFVFWKVIQKSLHIWTADSYNGLASVGDYSRLSVGTVLWLTYQKVAEYFLHPLRFITMTFREKDLSIIWTWGLRVGNLAMLFLLLIFVFLRNREAKTGLWHCCMQAVLLMLFPLGINFVCFLSQGMEHELMIYAFCLLPILTVVLMDRSGKKLLPAIIILCLALSMQTWCHIVYANQVYLKKQAQEDAARSIMSRIMYRIESMPDYIPGQTPVAFTGSFETSPYICAQTAFSELQPWGTAMTALSYIGTDYAYLGYFENMKMNLLRVDANDDRVRAMPCYPLEGSVSYVDGVLVVKISD